MRFSILGKRSEPNPQKAKGDDLERAAVPTSASAVAAAALASPDSRAAIAVVGADGGGGDVVVPAGDRQFSPLGTCPPADFGGASGLCAGSLAVDELLRLDPCGPLGGPGGELDPNDSLVFQPCGMENLIRVDCDYWDDAEDDTRNHISPSPRLPRDRGKPRGRSPGDRSLGSSRSQKLPLGQRLSGKDPEPAHLLGASVSSSSSGPKLAPSVRSDDEGDSRLDVSTEGAALPVGAIQGGKFCWVRGELIGRGSLGLVHRALEARTGQLMAVKEVVLDAQDKEEEKFRKSLQNEVDLYKDMQHPRIVSYLGHDYVAGKLYIYLEYMPGNSIAQVLSQFGPLDESLISRYTHNLLEGLEYLHTRDPPVLHRDIKGANILVGIDRTVKLSDFGCSKRSSGTAIHTLRGSIPWMAPEVMCQKVGYGRKADIWSLGCCVIEMSTAEPPWGTFDNCLAAMVRIAMSEETPPVPEHLSATCREFVSICTRRAPQERPDAADLLQYDFVSGSSRSAIDESWG